jgi:hypothetical protein
MIPGPFVLVGALRTAERRSLSSAGHLTGAAGRWSATHPWTAILAWLGCVVVLLLAGHLAGTIQVPAEGNGSGQTGQAQQMMSRDFPLRANEEVLFESSTLQVSAPANQAAIRDVLTRIQATGRVTQIRSPLDPANANQISANRHAALLEFQLTGNIVDDATSVVPVQAAAAAHPQIQIAETGDGTINKAVNDTIFRDLRRGCPDLVALSVEERVGHGPADEDPVGHADQNAERVELVPDLRPAGHHHVRPPDVSDQPAERAATVVSARPPSSRNERSS